MGKESKGKHILEGVTLPNRNSPPKSPKMNTVY